MAKKPGFSVEEHFAWGDKLKDAKEDIGDFLVHLSHKYPLQSKAVRNAKKCLDNIDDLKVEMDNIICRENPQLKEATKAYWSKKQK